MQEQLQASIIINTYNRESYLRRLLSGLRHLQSAVFEVVVVNGPSTDSTETLLNEYLGQIKIVDCETRNLSHSRNLGIAAAAGEIVVFIDDDAIPGDTNWLARYVEAFTSDTSGSLGAAGGPVFHRDTEWLEFNGGATSDYGFQIFDKAIMGQISLDNHRWVPRVQGCNCAFRRETLVAIGGFDEFFTYYHDETDVCLRLARAGFTVTHLPDNGVRHYPATSERRTSKFDRNWEVVTRSDTYFALKNGADPLPKRLTKTITSAPRKHYIDEINSYLRNGDISLPHWINLVKQWGKGFGDGLKAGLGISRQFGHFRYKPSPFLTYSTIDTSQQIKIALLSQNIPGQSRYGGVGRYTFDLARGLHERGHEIHIFCQDEQVVKYENLNFFIHGIAATKEDVLEFMINQPILNKNLKYSLAIVDTLAKLYEEGCSFDIVHASNWDCEAAALIRARVYPTVLMLVSPLAQVIQTENWQPNEDLRASVALDRWQIEQADTVCVPSDGVLGSYRSLMGITPENIQHLHTVALGIVPDCATIVEDSRPRYRLLFVGRCERRKGAHTLLTILPNLLTIYKDWECHFIGDDEAPLVEGGTLKTQFLEQHYHAPWLNRVVFHGSVSEEVLKHYYQNCDLFVAPSLFESFGLIYHEAMQYGKAVVGCHAGGVPEVVQDGVEGLLVEPDCPEALQGALIQLMSNDSLRAQMGQAGMRRVHKITNYRTTAAGMEQVYLETIARTGEERENRRISLWPQTLQLHSSSKELHFQGEWQQREVAPGCVYAVGQPDSVVSLEVADQSILILTALRHGWSGIAEVLVNQTHLCYIDFYKPDDLQPDYTKVLHIPGIGTEKCCVDIRVHREHNPRSLLSEVWLKQISLFKR